MPNASLVRGLIYPVPDPTLPFLGVHFTKKINGELWYAERAMLSFEPTSAPTGAGQTRFWQRLAKAIRGATSARPTCARLPPTVRHDGRARDQSTSSYSPRRSRSGRGEASFAPGQFCARRIAKDCVEASAFEGVGALHSVAVVGRVRATLDFRFCCCCCCFLTSYVCMCVDACARSLLVCSLGTTTRSGVRAQALLGNGALVDDFVIERHRHALHVRNAPSPAATASFAIAKHIVDQIVF